MAFPIRSRQTLLFVGDSITDCDRRGANAPLGNGYVRMVHEIIIARYPALRLNVINKGIGGNTVRDLAQRWSDDVIRFRLDWLSVKIGINDIHQWLRKNAERSVSPAEFAEMYDHILTRVRKETKANLVLVEPFYISTDRDPPQTPRPRRLLPRAGAPVRVRALVDGAGVDEDIGWVIATE